MGYMKRAGAVVVVTVLLAGCAQAGASEEVAASGESVVDVTTLVPVEVLETSLGQLQNELVFTGQLAPIDQAMVMPRMQGLVSAVYADVGDLVEEGQLLFTMDGRDIQNQINALQAQHSQAMASVASAQNALNNVAGGGFETQLLQQDANIESLQLQLETNDISMQNAQMSYDLALTSYNNTSILYSAGATPRAQFDQARTAYEQATIALEQVRLGREQIMSSLEQAERSREILVGQISTENQDAAALGVSSAQSAANVISVQIQNTHSQLEDLRVTSPISGVVNTRNASPNELATMAIPSFVIIDTSRLNVEVRVSEAIINQINPGDEVGVVVRSLGPEVIQGAVATVAPGVDATNTFGVTIEIDNPDGILRSGMFAEASFVREAAQGVVAIPIEAVLRNLQGQDYVYVLLADDTVQQVFVTTGISDGREVEIAEGLSPGDAVVVAGQTNISSGEAVNVVRRGVQ